MPISSLGRARGEPIRFSLSVEHYLHERTAVRFRRVLCRDRTRRIFVQNLSAKHQQKRFRPAGRQTVLLRPSLVERFPHLPTAGGAVPQGWPGKEKTIKTAMCPIAPATEIPSPVAAALRLCCAWPPLFCLSRARAIVLSSLSGLHTSRRPILQRGLTRHSAGAADVLHLNPPRSFELQHRISFLTQARALAGVRAGGGGGGGACGRGGPDVAERGGRGSGSGGGGSRGPSRRRPAGGGGARRW
jgi:uncharacterized membrane protein YgcG